MRNRSASPRRAFTLVELLAVIGIIAVMATVIGVSLTGGNATASLGTSQRVGASIFQSARSIAVLKQTPTKVLIYGDNGGGSDTGKYLRFMQVVYEDPESPGTWIAANTGTYLPQGVYYIPSNISNGYIDIEGGGTMVKSDPTTTFTSPVKPNENSTANIGFEAYEYTFDSNGLSDGSAGDQIVFAAGRVTGPPQGGLPQLSFDNEYAVVGFYLRRLGSVSLAEYDDLDK